MVLAWHSLAGFKAQACRFSVLVVLVHVFLEAKFLWAGWPGRMAGGRPQSAIFVSAPPDARVAEGIQLSAFDKNQETNKLTACLPARNRLRHEMSSRLTHAHAEQYGRENR